MILSLERKSALALLAMAVCFTGGVRAEDSPQEDLGDFGDWKAVSYKASDTKVCYISSQPKSSEPKNAKRDPIFLMVTHMPGRKVKGEISTIIGYPFKKDSTAELTIDGAKFELFTNGDGAWADSSATEKKIVAAMKAGKSLTLKGTSWRGTETTDSYSLEGLTAALAAIDKACK